MCVCVRACVRACVREQNERWQKQSSQTSRVRCYDALRYYDESLSELGVSYF